MKSFALVVARKGSTRLIGKNRLPLAGRPLFRWTLDAALDSGAFDAVVVSSDDEAILEECAGVAGVVPDRRPADLATEKVTALDVLRYMIPRAKTLCGGVDAFCLLQPTSPFRGPRTIREAMASLEEPEVEFAVGVAPFGSPPFFALSLENGVQPVNDGALTRVTRTQDVPALHHPAGGIFAGRVDAFLRKGHFYGPTTRGIPVGLFAAVDINTPEDFELTEALAPAVLARGRG